MKIINIKNKRAPLVDPFFEVQRVPLQIQKMTTGKESQLIPAGVDALVNQTTNQILSVVDSKYYKLITHKQVQELVFDFLSKLNIQFEPLPPECTRTGTRFSQTILFPKLKFNINTTLKELQKDDFIPGIFLKNSYDKSTPVCWDYGILRVVCQNGNAILNSTERLILRHTQSIENVSKLQQNLLRGLENSIHIMNKVLPSLLEKDPQPVIEDIFLTSFFSDKVKNLLIKIMGIDLTLEGEYISLTPRTQEFKITKIKTRANTYDIFNYLTNIASHHITNFTEKDILQKKIATFFRIAA